MPTFRLFTLVCLLPLLGFAQTPVRILLDSGDIWKGTLDKRKPGLSTVLGRTDGTSTEVKIPIKRIEKIIFDLSPYNLSNLTRAFSVHKYDEVLQKTKATIQTYFAYVDLDANSNQLVSLFLRSLYFAEKYGPAIGAARTIQKVAERGPMFEEARYYEALSLAKIGRTDEFLQLAESLEILPPHRDLSAASWMVEYEAAMTSNDMARAYPMIARVITMAPLDNQWIGRCLYTSAAYHHSQTNFVVANQILAELSTADPFGLYLDEGIALTEKLVADAAEQGISLTPNYDKKQRRQDGDFEAAIDYKKRQRALESGGATPSTNPDDETEN